MVMVIISLLRDAVHAVMFLYVCSYFQPGVVNKYGYTPLRLAVINKRLEVVKYLVTERNIDLKGAYD